MKLTEEGIRELLRRRRAHPTAQRGECLTEEQFLRAATRKMNDTERRQVASHLASCADCTDSYQMLLQLEPWAQEAERIVVSEASTDRRAARGIGDSIAAFWQQLIWNPRLRSIAAVALIVVAAGSVLVWQSVRQRPPAGSIERAPVTPKLNVMPRDKALVDEPPDALSWSPLEGATGYRVIIFDFQSSTVWESSRLRETSIRLPEPVRQRITRNQPYYWRVIAEDPLEERQSELFQFTVAAGEQR